MASKFRRRMLVAVSLLVGACPGDDSSDSTSDTSSTSATTMATSTGSTPADTNDTNATTAGTGTVGTMTGNASSGATTTSATTSSPGSSSGGTGDGTGSTDTGVACEPPPPAGNTCLECVQPNCCAAWQACMADVPCACVVDCHVVQGNSLGMCANSCNLDSDLYQGLYFCGQAACPGQCDWDCC